MHAVVVENLEEYLSGLLEPAEHREIEAHLTACEMCREEMRNMQDVSLLFGSMRTEEAFDPGPGFYARVAQRVEQRKSPTLAGLFGLDMVFGRRLVFGCLLMLTVLGSYLVSRETAFPGGPSPAAIMAEQNLPAFDSASAPDNMLVTLTAYEH